MQHSANEFYKLLEDLETRLDGILKNDPLGYADYFVVEHNYGENNIDTGIKIDAISDEVLDLIYKEACLNKKWNYRVFFLHDSRIKNKKIFHLTCGSKITSDEIIRQVV